jgi:hypothetical protein
MTQPGSDGGEAGHMSDPGFVVQGNEGEQTERKRFLPFQRVRRRRNITRPAAARSQPYTATGCEARLAPTTLA